MCMVFFLSGKVYGIVFFCKTWENTTSHANKNEEGVNQKKKKNKKNKKHQTQKKRQYCLN